MKLHFTLLVLIAAVAVWLVYIFQKDVLYSKESSWIPLPSVLWNRNNIQKQDGESEKGFFIDRPQFFVKVKEMLNILQKLNNSMPNNMQKQYVNQMQNILDSIVEDLKLNVTKKIENSVKKNIVCDEMFNGTLFGYPFYHTGWVTKKCKSRPFKDFLSMVILFRNLDKISVDDLHKIILGIRKKYPEVKMNIVVNKFAYEKLKVKNLTSAAQFHQYDAKSSEIKVLNEIISKTVQRYIFIAKDLERYWDEEVNLERLIWVLAKTDSKVVGGASRNTSGHWMNNCLQMNFRNYSLALNDGYHHSRYSCIYCDVLTGPFVAEVDFLKNNIFHEKLQTKISFYDFFLRQTKMKNSFMSCPDSMFFTLDIADKVDKKFWLPLAKEHMIHAIKLPNGDRIEFDCKDVQPNCVKEKSMAISPCCLKELADNIVFTMELLNKNNITCEISDGTLLSGVKMKTIFPWDIDADFICDPHDIPATISLSTTFKKRGIRLEVIKKTIDKNGHYSSGYIVLNSKNWFIEIWFLKGKMDSVQMIEDGLEPTKIPFHGRWLTTAGNPGKVARNRYGLEIYQHAEHWRRLDKKSSFEDYKPGTFIKCSKPGHHSCLDQYRADGSTQFVDVTT